tara:strand:- start:239 stop:448 length:210 start_codon:yes stop_codon:yes gene_type:complete
MSITEARKAYLKEYRQRPYVKARKKALEQTPKAIETRRLYNKTAPAFALAQLNHWKREYNRRLLILYKV